MESSNNSRKQKNNSEFDLYEVFQIQFQCTSKCRSVSISCHCFCLSNKSWFCNAANSVFIIFSVSWMAVSLTPSERSRCLILSVDTDRKSIGAMSSLLDILGNNSFTACNASIHATRSSRVSARKWSLFVPVKMENLLSSDRLSRIEETCHIKIQLNGGKWTTEPDVN